MNRLHPRVQVLWALRALLVAAVLGGAGAAGVALLGAPRWAPAVAAGVALTAGVALALARYRRWGYEIRADALYLERGVLTEVRTVVPFVRIQHVDSRRSPAERAAGLASVVVYTAGSRGADVRVPGLTETEARDLRERLKRLTITTGEEDAV